MIKKVGVVGSGVMGAGVAQSLAQHDIDVVLYDISKDALDGARMNVVKGLRMARLLGQTVATSGVEDPIERIEFSNEFDSLAQVDFIIENVSEKVSVKQEVYEQLDRTCQSDCVFAANTSAIQITQIASMCSNAERVVGTHFMNPVPQKKTVEVIRGFRSSDESVQTTVDLLASMGKDAVIVNDAPGFVSNRVLMLTINEAIFLLHEGVSNKHDVDKIFRSCFGHQMGPLETADLIGLDTILLSLEVLSDSFRDSKYRPCPLLQKMVFAGELGRKSGSGFYDYSDKN